MHSALRRPLQSRAVAQSAQATPTPSNDELRIHGVESSAGSLKLEISIPAGAGTLQANGFTLEGVAYEQADFTGLNARSAAYYTVFAVDGSGSFRGSRNIALSEIEAFGTTLTSTNQAEVLLFGLEVEHFGPFDAVQGLTDALQICAGPGTQVQPRLFNTLAKAIKH